MLGKGGRNGQLIPTFRPTGLAVQWAHLKARTRDRKLVDDPGTRAAASLQLSRKGSLVVGKGHEDEACARGKPYQLYPSNLISCGARKRTKPPRKLRPERWKGFLLQPSSEVIDHRMLVCMEGS